ncbi:MAG: hypothetical protein OHK0019_10590 [Saprospiraceae bacterium]
MNTFCLQILFFSISTLLVVEDFQYLFEKGISQLTQHEFALDDFCNDSEEETGSKSQKEESGCDEIKKKDENNNVTFIRLFTFYTLAIKNILSHASCYLSDIARELETPPPEV